MAVDLGLVAIKQVIAICPDDVLPFCQVKRLITGSGEIIDMGPVLVLWAVLVFPPDQSLASGLLRANTHTVRLIFADCRHHDYLVP